MFEVLRKILKTGIVTRHSPFLDAPARFRGIIKIKDELCNGCSTCVAACPRDAIQLERENSCCRIWINYDRCIFCHECIEVCPQKALKGSNQHHPAVRSRNDFVTKNGMGDKQDG